MVDVLQHPTVKYLHRLYTNSQRQRVTLLEGAFGEGTSGEEGEEAGEDGGEDELGEYDESDAHVTCGTPSERFYMVHPPSRVDTLPTQHLHKMICNIYAWSIEVGHVWGTRLYSNGCECIEVMQYLVQVAHVPHSNGHMWDI